MKIPNWQKILINSLTTSRIIISVGVFFLTDGHLLVIAVYAAVSDFLDGFLARRYSLVSKLGEWLDQTADKIFHLGFFYYLVKAGEMSFYFMVLFWLREVLMILFRLIDKVSKTSNFLGKLKTFLTYLLIIFFLTKRIFFSSGLFDFTFVIIVFQMVILSVSYVSLILSFRRI